MDYNEIISQPSCKDASQFWKSVNIWLNKPHVVNRRILVSSKVLTLEWKGTISEIVNWIETTEYTSLLGSSDTHATQNLISSLSALQQPINILNESSISSVENGKTYLNFAILLPRNTNKFSQTLEIAIIEKGKNIITFYHKPIFNKKQTLGFKFSYRFQYKDSQESNELSLSIQNSNDCQCHPSIEWLKTQLFPRLIKWMDENETNSFISGSLNLIPLDEYAELYSRLKHKYGLEIVKMWPEATDPSKFVYEDIAIASYLLILWEKERIEQQSDERQSFLDLGCGNGLLVHILSSEGHKGLGIDLRKRKIWDFFPENTHLEVRTIIPSSKSLFPDVDWLIGNHSDELTPWIPVIAARSSYKCRFFLLPCCAYEFDGRKYQRSNASRSQYSDYMHYINKVGQECGFTVKIDKLRIPSTKRTCFIGSERTYLEENTQEERIQKIIEERSVNQVNEKCKFEENSQWSCDFKPRENVEKVRNCTQLGKSVIIEIVDITAKQLLQKVRVISLKGERTWNAGGQIELSELVKTIAPETLKCLKNECGGLQTLLKNNSHIFCVEEGKVRLKMPGAECTSSRKKRKNNEVRRKEKVCWFHENHPDGCLLSQDECTFKHC